MTTEEERTAKIAKLPKWAQVEIDVLERNVAFWKSTVITDSEGSNTFIVHGLRADQPLGDSPSLRFNLGADRENDRISIDARIDGDKLILTGYSGCLAITPSSSNRIHVRVSDIY